MLGGWGWARGERSCPLPGQHCRMLAQRPSSLAASVFCCVPVPPSREAQLTAGPQRWPSLPAGTRAGCECVASGHQRPPGPPSHAARHTPPRVGPEGASRPIPLSASCVPWGLSPPLSERAEPHQRANFAHRALKSMGWLQVSPAPHPYSPTRQTPATPRTRVSFGTMPAPTLRS